MNEQEYAIMEGSRIHCADEYLNARFGYDDPARRKLFEAGHDAGWKAATAASQAREAELQSENAELRKLLEESKVPEGWRLAPNEPTVEMRNASIREQGFILRAGLSLQGDEPASEIYKAMLAAAPQPKEPKQ